MGIRTGCSSRAIRVARVVSAANGTMPVVASMSTRAKEYTSAGLRMRAAAFNATIARLSGVRVARVLTVGWALAPVTARHPGCGPGA